MLGREFSALNGVRKARNALGRGVVPHLGARCPRSR